MILLTLFGLLVINQNPSEKNIIVRKNGISVRIQQSRPSSAKSEADRWGIEGAVTPYVVKRIVVVVDGRTWTTFRSAYSDLSNVNRVVAYRKNRNVVIKIEGGDAASSFEAVLVYQAGFIRSRTVVDTELREERREQTTYTTLIPKG